MEWISQFYSRAEPGSAAPHVHRLAPPRPPVPHLAQLLLPDSVREPGLAPRTATANDGNSIRLNRAIPAHRRLLHRRSALRTRPPAHLHYRICQTQANTHRSTRLGLTILAAVDHGKHAGSRSHWEYPTYNKHEGCGCHGNSTAEAAATSFIDVTHVWKLTLQATIYQLRMDRQKNDGNSQTVVQRDHRWVHNHGGGGWHFLNTAWVYECYGDRTKIRWREG